MRKVRAIVFSDKSAIEDVSLMTGFTRNTLKSIENGQNTDTSHLIEIAKAIGDHPKDFFDIQKLVRDCCNILKMKKE